MVEALPEVERDDLAGRWRKANRPMDVNSSFDVSGALRGAWEFVLHKSFDINPSGHDPDGYAYEYCDALDGATSGKIRDLCEKILDERAA